MTVGVGNLYRVSSAGPWDAGEYRCVATNSCGQMEGSLTVTVSVTSTKGVYSSRTNTTPFWPAYALQVSFPQGNIFAVTLLSLHNS